MALYSGVLLMSGLAYWLLQTVIIRSQGKNSPLAKAVGSDKKGKASPVLYILAIGLSFVSEWLAMSILVLVALMWLVPDQRIEKQFVH